MLDAHPGRRLQLRVRDKVPFPRRDSVPVERTGIGAVGEVNLVRVVSGRTSPVMEVQSNTRGMKIQAIAVKNRAPNREKSSAEP